MACNVPCGVSELAYSPQKLIQQDIDHSYHVSLTPHNSIIPGNNIIFHIEGSTDWTDLGNTLLEIDFQVKTSAGADVESTKNVCPVNNIFHSLWSQVKVQIKNTVVSFPSSNYGYKAYLEHLVNYSADSKNTWMQALGWHMDEATKFDLHTNSALAIRRKYIEAGAMYKVRGKLSTDIGNQPLLIPSHTDVTYTLTPQSDRFALMNFETATDYKIVIASAKLLVRKVKLYPDRINQFERMIAKDPIRIPISQVKVTAVSVPANMSTFEQTALFSGELPQVLLCGLVSNASFAGQKNLNPFNFTHASLNSIQIKLNELLIPTYPISLNFTKKLVYEGYESLFQLVNKWAADWSNGLSIEDYVGGSALYGFHLSQDSLCRGDEPPLMGQVDISLKFDRAPDETMTLIIYSATPAEIVIDKFRNVLLSA